MKNLFVSSVARTRDRMVFCGQNETRLVSCAADRSDWRAHVIPRLPQAVAVVDNRVFVLLVGSRTSLKIMEVTDLINC
jgi:hypothetical protein